MTEESPSLAEWRGLYEAAVRFRDVHPWAWMLETDLFGIENPETGEIYYASVMGNIGEHFALALYRGSQALFQFWRFQETADTAPPEALLEIPHLQASFEDRDTLHAGDRETIKTLGLKFRGRGVWPMFRSYRPAYVPWTVTTEEARCLTWGLEQALEVGLRFKDDPTLLRSPDEESYLVRTPSRRGGALKWKDRRLRPVPFSPPLIALKMDIRALDYLRHLQHSKMNLQIDLFMFPSGVRDEKASRPFFPYNLMLVDAKSGFVLGTELLSPVPALEDAWGMVPLKIVQALAMHRMVPRRITVRSPLLHALVTPLAAELGIQLKQSDSLPALDEAKEFMLARFV